MSYNITRKDQQVYPNRDTQEPRQTREIVLDDFPPRHYREPHHQKYLDKQGLISTSDWKSVYPCRYGYVFVLYGYGLGFQVRVTDPHHPKYVFRFDSPYGFVSGKFVFVPDLGVISMRDAVYVVEGVADAVAVWQEGKAAIGLIGSNLTSDRIRLVKDLTYQKQVVMIPDNDAPGEKCSSTLLASLPGVSLLRLPSIYKDICDMPREDRSRFLTY